MIILIRLILGGIFTYKRWLKANMQTNHDSNKNIDQSTISENVISNEKTKTLDSDGDGMTDAWENSYGYALNEEDSSDANKDNDKDGLINIKEFQYHTDPTNPDSDSDTFSDYVEIQKGFNPNGEGKLKK